MFKEKIGLTAKVSRKTAFWYRVRYEIWLIPSKEKIRIKSVIMVFFTKNLWVTKHGFSSNFRLTIAYIKTRQPDIFLILKRQIPKLILAANVSIPSTKCKLKVKVSFENMDVCFEKNKNLD